MIMAFGWLLRRAMAETGVVPAWRPATRSLD
jgi:hypothetical protein